MTAPPGIAAIERTFSGLRIVDTWRRGSLGPRTVDMLCYIWCNHRLLNARNARQSVQDSRQKKERLRTRASRRMNDADFDSKLEEVFGDDYYGEGREEEFESDSETESETESEEEDENDHGQNEHGDNEDGNGENENGSGIEDEKEED